MSSLVAAKEEGLIKELNIAVIGGVDCGKSSLLSVLKNGELDDGKGLARSKIVKFKHELESGRTSAINQHYIQINPEKICCLIDLCGHEQYLHTTLHGMCGFYVDFAIIVVGGNLSITEMTKEHLNSCLSLNIPFIVVITKVDMSPPHVLAKTKEVMTELLTQKVKMRNIVWMKEDEVGLDLKNLMKNIPIFTVSNKTGDNVDYLRKFIFQLPVRRDYYEENLKTNPENKNVLFSIDNFFSVKGVGMVVSGKTFKGNLEKNQKLFIGPLAGQYFPVSTRTFHDNFENSIEGLKCGMSGCVSLKSLNKQFDYRKFRHRKGVFLMNEEEMKNSIYFEFEADVIVIGKHSTQISKNYTPVINCKKIVQCAKILEIYDKEYIRPGEMSKMKFRFQYRPEYIQVNDRFIFREGATRGVGIIRNVLVDSEKE